MRHTTGWQSVDTSTAMKLVNIERRELRPDDVAVQVDYCGVCGSDLHVIGFAPDGGVVPGHEFVGTVTAVGDNAKRFAVGDAVAVGAYVDSCGECVACRDDKQMYCPNATLTYFGQDRVDGSATLGGYSREYVIRETYAYPLPAELEAAGAAPLLCAGITVWAPLAAAGVGPGSRVGVAGLGGLGHLAVKFAAALGAQVTVFSRTADKEADARALGAQEFVLTTDDDALTAAAGTIDLFLDVISAEHDLGPLIKLVAISGTYSLLGHYGPTTINTADLMLGGRNLTSSAIGGLDATAEMLAFAAKHSITADVEVLPSTRVTEALDRLERGDVRYRFVLDMADLDAISPTNG